MRQAKRAGLRLMRALGLFRLMRFLTGKGVRILCYHGAWLGRDNFPGDTMFMHGATFASRLDSLVRLGYPVIPLELAVAGLAGRSVLPRAAVVLTIDDGWYGFYRDMWPALSRLGLPATLYVDTEHLLSLRPVPHVMARYFARIAGSDAATEIAATLDRSRALEARLESAEALGTRLGLDVARYVDDRAFAYMTPAELGAAAADGLDIQLHTHHHTLGDFSAATVAAELGANRAALAHLLGRAPDEFAHFCYPSGVHDPQVGPILARLGIASATTTDAGIAYPGADRYFLPRLLDGENLSQLEFEAELAGIGEFLRLCRRYFWNIAERMKSSAK
jgi:peptidoglycan/xylan/chitin deacetylase (PgdA/CDA1 family)